jgi:hypothetical protein
MAMSKGSIYDFAGRLYTARVMEVQKEQDDFYAKHLDPTFNALIKSLIEDIPFYAERMLKVLEAKRDNIEALGGIRESSMDSLIAMISTKGLYLFATIRDNARSSIIYKIEHPYDGAFDYGNAELNALVDRLQKDTTLVALVKRESDLNALHKELNSSINACRSGKQAYDTMVRLGVDMSEYKAPLDNLPAIVKLSADVCLLNGTC